MLILKLIIFICLFYPDCFLLSMLPCRDEGVTKAAVGVLGDLADALGSNIKMLFKDRAFCMHLLDECLQSEDEQLKQTAVWTQGIIGRVCG